MLLLGFLYYDCIMGPQDPILTTKAPPFRGTLTGTLFSLLRPLNPKPLNPKSLNPKPYSKPGARTWAVWASGPGAFGAFGWLPCTLFGGGGVWDWDLSVWGGRGGGGL